MKKPNIILISIDTLRADHLSCYGYRRQTTPNIDRIANEGTVFRQNYSTGVWTPPGHASMLTGLYVSEHGVYGERRLSDDIHTIATVLKENGYQTAGFVNNSQVGELVGFHKGHDTFVEVWKGIKFKSIIERIIRGFINLGRRKLGYEDKGASRTNALFKGWLNKKINKNKPFYAFLHYIEPHNPLNPPRPFKNKFLDNSFRNIDKKKIKKVAHNPLICFIEDLSINEEEIKFLKDLYDGEIAYTDSKIGKIVEILKENNLYDDTMIIITSDHGEHFGEYGLWSHVASLYNEVLKIPLIIKYPESVEYIKEVNEYTQLVDIFPTIMDVVDLSKEEVSNNSGVSLVYDRDYGNKYHEYIFAEWEGRVPCFIKKRVKGINKSTILEKITNKMTMIQDKYHKYILKSDGTEEIYAVSDGTEKIKSKDVDREIIDRLSKELYRIKKSVNDYDENMNYSIDSEIIKNLKTLGYM